MVALSMATLFIYAIMTIAEISARSYHAQERVSDAQQSLRAALDLMVRDIRMAGYDPMAMTHGPTAGIGILTATDTRLQFSMDLNADRADNGGLENLTYFYDPVGKRLRQKEGGAAYPQTFIENVSALRFSYFNADGEPAHDLFAARLKDVEIVIHNQGFSGDEYGIQEVGGFVRGEGPHGQYGAAGFLGEERRYLF